MYASVNGVSIGSGNSLSPVWRQAITWTNACLLLIALPGTNFSEIQIWIRSISFKKMHLKLSSTKMAAILFRRRWVNWTLRNKLQWNRNPWRARTELIRFNSQYPGCRCPGPLHHQDISTHDIDWSRIGKYLFHKRKDFNHLCHVCVEDCWYQG